MTVSVWQDKSGARHLAADVAVVGAGVVGSYLALALTRRGLDVVVLEMRFPASGATGRNAGMVLTGTGEYYHTAAERHGRERARAIWRATVENREATRRLHDELGLAYDACGSLRLAVSEEEARDLALAHEQMRADGLEGVLHEGDPLNRGFLAALEQPKDLGINPVAFVEAMLKASGAHVVEDCEVFDLAAEGYGVVLRSRLATVRAGVAMLATNAYSPLLHPFFRALIAPTRGQVLVSAPVPRVIETLCYANYGYEYFRQLRDGRMLVGGWRQRYADVEVGYADEVTPGVQAGLEGFLRERFPELGAGVERRWSGVMGFSRTGLPIVGQLPELPGVGYAVGFTGHGLGLGIAAADALIGLLLDGAPPGAFVEPDLTASPPG